MERNGQVYCDECHLAIFVPARQFRTVAREASEGKPARVAYFHARGEDDCWPRALAKAKALQEAKSAQFAFSFAAVKGVVN